jgi:protocatechuate 3,4-dioxygenase beta subunit
MRTLRFSTLRFGPILAGLVFIFSAGGRAQSPAVKDAKAATISGRVTVEGKPLSGAFVLLTPGDQSSEDSAIAKAATDEDGRYMLSNVAAGHYMVCPYAPAYIFPAAARFGTSGKPLYIVDGGAVDGLDFALVRGGVITGRVADPAGRPVIAERIQLSPVDERGNRRPLLGLDESLFVTDDQGNYRLYGLLPGRYLVSAGQAKPGVIMEGGGRTYYPITFHPGVASESRATLVEVRAGADTANVNISLGGPIDTFTASGKVVDAESGKPMSGVRVGYASFDRDGSLRDLGASPGWRSGADGRFRIEGITPGSYAVVTIPGDDESIYSDPVPFDVNRSDASGLEVKTRKGASIAGAVAVEGTNDPAVLQKIPQLELTAESAEFNALESVNPEADGSFHISGLPPGKFNINLDQVPQGLSFSRIERNGEAQTQGIDLGAGQQVAGVRIILTYGSCKIRGSVSVQGGALPETSQVTVVARRVGPDSRRSNQNAVIDARGQFVIDGLLEGDYELYLRAYPWSRRGRPSAAATVTVSHESEAEVTLTLDLSQPRQQ